MEATRFPRSLVFAGQVFNYAGRGRGPGSHVYMNASSGNMFDAYLGRVVSTGTVFAICTVAENSAIPAVRVDHSLFNGTGRIVLNQEAIVSIQFETGGPRATAVWPVESNNNSQPPTIQKLGAISAIKIGFGFIRPLDGSADSFFHCSELRGFTPRVGMTVRYSTKAGPDGRPQAADVRPA